MMMSEVEALYGTTELPIKLQEVSAGPLSIVLEGGNLRYVRFEGLEVLRAVSFLVRDTRWGTYTAKFNNLEVEQGVKSILISYEALCCGPEGRFDYRVGITGDSAGHLSFHAEGSAPADFPANRIGFVVLHPLEGVAGSVASIEHTDGRLENLLFPEHISPDQPAFDIRAISHEVDGLSVRVELHGDAFEMEDHRNWTDASFKTYIRPLSKPRPFILRANEVLKQSVIVSISGRRSQPAISGALRHLEIKREGKRLPKLGLGFDPEDAEPTLLHAHIIRELHATTLDARFDLVTHDHTALRAINAVGRALNADVMLEAIVSGYQAGDELMQLARRCRAANLAVSAILACPARDMKTRPSNMLPSGEASANDIAVAARNAFPHAIVGGGMITSFTEMNRNRPAIGLVDFVSHVTCANIHAADDVSVMETLEALEHVMRSTRQICGNIPYRIGPSAIGLRENPYGMAVAENPLAHRVTMARKDPRHCGLFGAAWTLSYAAVAMRHDIDMLTLAHGVGDFGVVNADGTLRPLYHVLRGLGGADGSEALTVETGSRLIGGLGFLRIGTPEIWIANKSAEYQEIDLGQISRVASLSADNFDDSRNTMAFLDKTQHETRILVLPPFAIARVVSP